MERHCENSMKVARHLEARTSELTNPSISILYNTLMHSFCPYQCISDPDVAWVRYPGLPSDPQHHKSQKYLKGTGEYKAYRNLKMTVPIINVVTITLIHYAGGPMVVFGIKSANAKETGWVHSSCKIPLASKQLLSIYWKHMFHLGKNLLITWNSFRTLLMSEM